VHIKPGSLLLGSAGFFIRLSHSLSSQAQGLLLKQCFHSCREIGETRAPVSIRKRRHLGIGCVCAFYWSIANSNLANVKLKLDY